LFSTNVLAPAYRLDKLDKEGIASYAHPKDVQDSDIFSSLLLKEFVEQTENKKNKVKLDFSGASNTIKILSDLMENSKSEVKEKHKIKQPKSSLSYVS
jgi:predicted glycosyltransferase